MSVPTGVRNNTVDERTHSFINSLLWMSVPTVLRNITVDECTHGCSLLWMSVPTVEMKMWMSVPTSVSSGRVAAAHSAVEPSHDAAGTVKDRRLHCFCFSFLLSSGTDDSTRGHKPVGPC